MVPPPASTKRGHIALAGPVDARQVEVDDAIPFVGGEGLDGADRRNRGVVHEDVDAAQRLPRALRHGGDGSVVSDVGGDADRRSSLGADRVRVALRTGTIEIGNRDGRAFGREALGGRGADARGATGHQRPFACQTHWRLPPGPPSPTAARWRAPRPPRACGAWPTPHRRPRTGSSRGDASGTIIRLRTPLRFPSKVQCLGRRSVLTG